MDGCSGAFVVLAVAFIISHLVKLAIRRNASPRPSSNEQPGTVASADTRPPPTAEFEGYGYLAVVGESQYQMALRVFLHRGRIHWAKLVPEPDNPFDRNAVLVEIDGHTVGYMSRADARRYQRRLLPLAAPIEVPAKLIGGTDDKPSIGVLLDHREVERMPEPKRSRKRKPEIPPADQPF
jgi:hypothetical protein